MLEQSVVYAPRLGYPLYVTAKRYWLPEFEQHRHDPDALTLVFLHSTSFHKETWEPTVEGVFQLAQRNPESGVKIREAWAIDAPNHGVSAELNEKELLRPEFFNNFTCEKYAHAVHHFLCAGPDHGACVDFRNRNLVGIGHSLGGVAMSILQHLDPVIKFSSIILVEPILSPEGREHLADLRLWLVKAAYERRDVWPNRGDALAALKNTQRVAKWHPQVLDLYVKYALRMHPASKHLVTPYDGVTLACSREQEASMYRDDVDGPTKPVEDLNKACADMPVHIVFGAEKDFIPVSVQNAVMDPASGRRFASITRLEGAGHLVPQETPEKLAEVVHGALSDNARISRHEKARSKL